MSSENIGVATQGLAEELLGTLAQNTEGLYCPSLAEIFSESAQLSPAIEPPQAGLLPLHEQEALFRSVEDALKQADRRTDAVVFEGVPRVLFKLWNCQSQYLVQATEALANGSRNRQSIMLSLSILESLHYSFAPSVVSSFVQPGGDSQLFSSAYSLKGRHRKWPGAPFSEVDWQLLC
jgi:hypothetical protein